MWAGGGFQKHIKEHHEEVRERPCPHPGCNKVFMIDRYLQRHVKLIHTGEVIRKVYGTCVNTNMTLRLPFVHFQRREIISVTSVAKPLNRGNTSQFTRWDIRGQSRCSKYWKFAFSRAIQWSLLFSHNYFTLGAKCAASSVASEPLWNTTWPSTRRRPTWSLRARFARSALRRLITWTSTCLWCTRWRTWRVREAAANSSRSTTCKLSRWVARRCIKTRRGDGRESRSAAWLHKL